MKKKLSLIPVERIENIIYVIRGQRVMMDEDLAQLYGVPTKRFNEQIYRNIDRFPEDFAFQLTKEEWGNLRSQFATSSSAHGGRRYLPYVFTEHGVVMLANVLRSKRATIISVEVVRAFIRFRQMLASHQEFAKEIITIKSFTLKYAQKTDQEFRKVWRAIEKLSEPPPKPERRIGFDLGQGQ